MNIFCGYLNGKIFGIGLFLKRDKKNQIMIFVFLDRLYGGYVDAF